MGIIASNPFKRRHYIPVTLSCGAYGGMCYPTSVAQMAEMSEERGVGHQFQSHLALDQNYGPELDKWRRGHLKPTNKSGRVDETYINVKGHERFSYRAIDLDGQTIVFLLTAKQRRSGSETLLSQSYG